MVKDLALLPLWHRFLAQELPLECSQKKREREKERTGDSLLRIKEKGERRR